MKGDANMKETFEIAVQLPFDDYAVLQYEMTEEEYDAFLEYCDDESIWDEDQYEGLLSAAAAEYIVGFYCETEDAHKVIDENSCTLEKLMEYLDEDEDYIAEVMAGDGRYKREIVIELLYENQAFTLGEA